MAEIKAGKRDSIELGNLEARRDWGWAPDYLWGIWLMLQQPKPDDYILATGEAHSVREFVETAATVAGVSSPKIISNVTNLRPMEVPSLLGSYDRANKVLGWAPSERFSGLVYKMMSAAMNRQEYPGFIDTVDWSQFPLDPKNNPPQA